MVHFDYLFGTLYRLFRYSNTAYVSTIFSIGFGTSLTIPYSLLCFSSFYWYLLNRDSYRFERANYYIAEAKLDRIKVREYGRGNQKWTNTNNVNKTNNWR